jgi:hypothetical protein
MGYKVTASKPFTAPLRFGQGSEGINVQTISAALTLDAYASTWNIINGGAANRDVTLPPLATSDGMVISIRSSGANSLVVKDDAASPNTISTVTTGTSHIFGCTGGAWYRVH